MQCSNCQFENIPGVRACGRCGASLELDSLPIDVHPPRATAGRKRWRRWFPFTRYWNRLNATVERMSAALRFRGWPADLQTPAVLLRMIVPGWAQRYTGRVVRARWMFGGYLVLLLTGLLFLGTALGWLLLGLAISLHAASILDVTAGEKGTGAFCLKGPEGASHKMRLSPFPPFPRLIYSAAALFLLFSCIYYPAWRLLSLVASPRQFNVAAAPIETGDVLLVNPSAYRRSKPQPGDLVHYRLSAPDVNVPNPNGHGARMYRFQGERINRILAQGGQKVTCSRGELLIDGQPSPWTPLGERPLPAALDITVPANSYLIFPSTDEVPVAVWPTACIVPRDQIFGRVYWRNQPLWRFGPVR